jgi:hypothetical protein
LKTKFSENKSRTEKDDRSDIIGRLITKERLVLRVEKGDYGGLCCGQQASVPTVWELGGAIIRVATSTKITVI